LAAFGIDTDFYKGLKTNGDREGQIMGHLGVELEVDYSFSDNFGAFIGAGFEYENMTEENRADLEIKEALSPYFGVFYSVGNLTVSTSLGLDLSATNKKGDDSVALIGGLDFSVKF
jgi:hypothetical protein